MPPEAETLNLTLGDRIVEKGLRLYGKMVNRENLPLHKRIFLESVIDARKDPITEESLKEPEREALLSVVRAKYKPIEPSLMQYEKYLATSLARHKRAVSEKNKDRIMYPQFVKQYEEDLKAIRQYKKGVITQDFIDLTSGNINYERAIGLRGADVRTPFRIRPALGYDDYPVKRPERNVFTNRMPEALEQTFGQIAYSVDPKTKQLVFKEDYDFNPPISGTAPSAESQLMAAPEGGGSSLYNAVRVYAGKVMPPGKGRPVELRFNQLAPPSQNALAP